VTFVRQIDSVVDPNPKKVLIRIGTDSDPDSVETKCFAGKITDQAL
jgi:hypothetical protein